MKTEVSTPTAECPYPWLWMMHDSMTAEVEVIEFLAQLVRTVKPQIVVETGTHLGFTAVAIGKALSRNGRGKLVTCERDAALHEKANQTVAQNGLTDFVEAVRCDSLELEVPGSIDMLFSDSAVEVRMREVSKFWPQLRDGALVLVHDVNTGAHRHLREQVIADGRLTTIFLPTPRGLAICQKRAGA